MKSSILVCVLALIFVSITVTFAQAPRTMPSDTTRKPSQTVGRWSLGAHGGANLWMADFTKRKIGAGGELFVRYGISRYLSAGVLAGYEELKTEVPPASAGFGFDYLKLHAMPGALVGWWHLAPGGKVVPYVYVGIGAMLYKRETAGSSTIATSKFLTSILVPVGIGFEVFANDNISFALDGGFRVTDDWTDVIKKSGLDGYANVRAGMNIYIGANDAGDDDNDGLTNGDERTWGTNPRNPDSDGDGLLDGEEVHTYKTHPLKPDTDGDGLNDGEEVKTHKTDPNKTDTDEDGLLDGLEVNTHRTDPLKTDTDGDTLTDGDEILKYKSDPMKTDTDGDTLADNDEVMKFKTDPSKADTDGDGLGDAAEVNTHHTDPLKVDTDGGSVNDGAEINRGTNPLDPKDDIMVLEKGKTVVLEGVNFEFNSAKLTEDSTPILERAYEALVANPDVNVEIQGHTDAIGSDAYNMRLSRRRAESVRNWLVQRGIKSERMTTVGKGEREPVASNETVTGRALNRRIEFHVK
ncbi:MAG: OmpA family protein [Ignavibacteriae bacterium]|nr:OmpA family protein [Ignavibacteriota bacterium]